MRIVIDQYIPFLEGIFEPYAEVLFLPPDAITKEVVRDADALIIRTRTRCDAHLLDHSRVRFIATATIGFDHIDTVYCHEHHIAWTACPGCNAQAVCDYIEEVLRTTPNAKSIGIVGVGHVGSLVAQMAQQIGGQVVLNDPPRAERENDTSLLGDVTRCDIITFHTPLTRQGRFPTYHLCDASFLAQCRPDTLIINAARGGIVDEQALLGSRHPCVIDCWEGEPHIHEDLLLSPHTLLASYHIAGYSLEGKRNASLQCVEQLSRFFSLPISIAQVEQTMAARLSASERGDSRRGWLQRLTEQFRAHPDRFEILRKAYPLR